MEQQVEALARLIVAERDVGKAAHHANVFIERLMKGLCDALPDQTKTISVAFQAISPRSQPHSAEPLIVSDARSGGMNKESGPQQTSAVTRADYQRIQSILNPFPPTTASDAQQSEPTIYPGENPRNTLELSKSKGKDSASQEQFAVHDRLLVGSHDTGESQHSPHAASTNLSGSETTLPNSGQVSQGPLLTDELDSVSLRPEHNSLDDAAEHMSVQPSPSPQISSSQAEAGMSGISQSSDLHSAQEFGASAALQGFGSRPLQAQGIRHEKQGGVITLYPTADQCENLSLLIRFARQLGADKDGLCKVILPQNGPACSFSPPEVSVKVQTNRFTARPREDGTLQVIRTEQLDDLNFGTEETSPTTSTDGLIQKFELLARSPNGFEHVRYCIDLDATQEDQRRKIGLPPKSPIFPLEGNRLSETKTSIPGIHAPYAYVSGRAFGAPFAMHVEDCYLSSVNYLYAGEKIWFVLEPEHGKILEERLAASGTRKTCSQFLRHSARYIMQSSLEKWGISYRVIRQMPNEVIVTFPGAYHQGFSTGFTCAEAVNYADQDWNTEGYSFCNGNCPRYSILAHMMAPLREGELQQDQAQEDADMEEDEEAEGDESGEAEVVARGKKMFSGKGPTGEFKGTKRKSRKGLTKGVSKRRQTMVNTKAHIENVALPRKFNWALEVIKNADSIGLDYETQRMMALLFCNIGSPGAIQQLRTACAALREKATLPDQKGIITACQAVRLLDTLDDRGFAMLILRRYYLARLVQCRQDAGATYKSQRAARKRTQKRLPRPETSALEDLMSQAYPSLSNDNEDYKRKYKSLQNRISSGNNWHLLVEEFGHGILALVPATDDVPNSSIERLAHQPFQHLVGALRKRRGWFLRELSERVSRHLLGMISGQEPARRFLFEEEDCNLLEETEDSPRLIELCSLNEG